MLHDANNPIQKAESVENNVFTVLDDRVLNPVEDDTYTLVNENIVEAKNDAALAGFWAEREAAEREREPVTSG